MWFFLADDPDTSYFFSEEEKEFSRARRRRDTGQTDSAQQFHLKDALEGAADWKVWLMAFSQFGVDSILFGYSVFLPTIIKGIGPEWSAPMV